MTWRCARTGLLVALVALVAGLGGCAGLNSAPDRTALRGAFWWMTADDLYRPVDAWTPELEELETMGLRRLVLQGPIAGRPVEGPVADPTGVFLDALDEHGMSAMFSTLARPDWFSNPDPTQEIARARKRIDDVVTRYGGHPAFAGFYLPYDLYFFWDAQRALVRTLFREVSAYAKQAAPDADVLISPYFVVDSRQLMGNYPWVAPEAYEAFWREMLEKAAIDVVALKDGGEHIAGFTWADIEPFIGAMYRACARTGTAFWANVELVEINVPSMDAYAARFGPGTAPRDPRVRPFWRAIPAEKLAARLEQLHAYTGSALVSGYREYIRPRLGGHATGRYLAYYEVLHP